MDSMMDALKKLGNFGDLFKEMAAAREKMEKLNQEMARKQITADAGGGMVQATVNGKMELVKLKIDSEKVDVNDLEFLEDLVVAAVGAAQRRAADVMREEMEKYAKEMGLPPEALPGMG